MGDLVDHLERGEVARGLRLVEEFAALEDQRFALPRCGFEIWRRWIPEGMSMPPRAALDPLELGSALLPSVVLLEVLQGGSDFQWRIFGSAHEREYGVDLRGVVVSDLMARDPGIHMFLDLFGLPTRQAAPVWYLLEYESAGHVLRAVSGVLLPLHADDGDDRTVSHLFGVNAWFNPLD